jgi:hypothetical protein
MTEEEKRIIIEALKAIDGAKKKLQDLIPFVPPPYKRSDGPDLKKFYTGV